MCSNGLPGSSESRDFFSDWYSNDAEPAPQPGWGLLRLCERDMLCVPVKCECRGELHFDRVDDAVLDRNAPYEHPCWKSMVIFLNLTLEPRLSLRRSSQPMRLGATTRSDRAGPMALPAMPRPEGLGGRAATPDLRHVRLLDQRDPGHDLPWHTEALAPVVPSGLVADSTETRIQCIGSAALAWPRALQDMDLGA